MVNRFSGFNRQLPALRRFARLLKRSLWIAVGLAICLAVLPSPSPQFKNNQPEVSQAGSSNWFKLPTASAQRLRIEDIWQQIYQQIPELPLENQYVNDETGEVSTDNTLINRLIRYHIYTKGRPINYRLDWKLTLADYLGANEKMDPATYPSGTSLRVNPLEGDIAAINRLTRAQRDALVDALVALFNPNAQTEQPASLEPSPEPSLEPAVSPSPAPSRSQPATSRPRFPQLPQPGDAELLQP